MSLNGLDASPVQEAYQAALNEAGGWFLLKYISRDSVELYSRGRSGVHEARNAIAAYKEQSPLYGLIIYRRRKILIKYIPEGTSRLLQARTAVHFQDVLERYSPYETLLEITIPDGLNDTALAASFPLHTASPATSTHRLHEISEDAEDGGSGTPKMTTNPVNNTGAIFGTQRYKMERRVDQLMRADRPTSSLPLSSETRARSPPASLPQKPSVSQFLVREDSGKRSITSLNSMPSISDSVTTAITDGYPRSSAETATVNSNETPKSSGQSPHKDLPSPSIPERSADRPLAGTERIEKQSFDRSTITSEPSDVTERAKVDDYDPYDFSKFDIKPKVKLGPRPVNVVEKPKGTPSIASIPAGFKQMVTKKQESTRPKSHGPGTLVSPTSDVLPAPPPIPDVPEYNPRPVSRGSVKSLPSHKSGAMTADKIRLMKALELRKKQMRKSNPQQGKFVPPSEAQLHDIPQVPSQPDAAFVATDAANEGKTGPATIHQPQTVMEKLNMPTKKPDSGIEMDYDAHDNSHADKKENGPWQRNTMQMTPAVVPSTNREPSSKTESKYDSNIHSPVSPGAFEPTMSSDMLESLPVPTAHMPTRDTPTLEKLNNPLGETNQGDVELPAVPKIVMADGSRPISPISSRDDEDEQGPDQTSSAHRFSPPDGAATSINPKRKGSDLAKRRRGMVQPLHIETSGETDSEDEFYAELQSATFQEATPVTVARTPVKQTFDRRPSLTSLSSAPSMHSIKSINITNRASTIALDKPTEPVEPVPVRNTAVTPIEEVTSSESTPVDEKPDALARRNVSSGISKRIQALSEVSSREIAAPSHVAEVRPLSPMVSEMQQPGDRNSSLRTQARSRTSTYRRQSKRNSSNVIAAGSTLNGMQSNPAVWNVTSDPATNRSSISVTARIVRPTHVADMALPSQPDTGHLQQSEIVINQKRMSAAPKLDARLPRIETETQPMPRSESAAEMTISPVESTTTLRSRSSTNQSANRRSIIGRHRHQPSLGPSPDDFPPPPSHMITSGTSFMNWGDESATPKEGSRTSRFFKRMSGFGVNKRKSIIQGSDTSNLDGLTFGRSTPSIAAQDRDMPPAVVVGVLNVQFPDTLLWKRRNVEIDNSGNLVFTSPHGLDIAKGLAKKYQLADFHLPYHPDLDRQELPYSIMLDFVDGSTLQIACEDTMAHRQVIQLLRTHWKAWNNA